MLEASKEIRSVGRRIFVTANAGLAWCFPAKTQMSGVAMQRGSVSNSLEVNSVELVFGGKIKDSLDECGTVPRSDRPGEETGAGPPAYGGAGHRTVRLCLLNELSEVGRVIVRKTEGGWIWGGETKNTYERLSRTMGQLNVRKRVEDDTVLVPVDAGRWEGGAVPSRVPGGGDERGCGSSVTGGRGRSITTGRSGSHEGRGEDGEQERGEHVVENKGGEREV